MQSLKLWINIFGEFGPTALFLFVYNMYSFQAATIAMIIATLVSFVSLYLYERHAPLFAIVSASSVSFFGIISLVIKDPRLFILRDTLSDGILGIALLISLRYEPLLELFFSYVFAITERGWYLLTLRWGIFCILLSVINEFVREMFTPDTWVQVKLVIIAATFIFGVYQLTLSRRERLPEGSSWGLRMR